jgi:hypothetical protein
LRGNEWKFVIRSERKEVGVIVKEGDTEGESDGIMLTDDLT